MKSVLLSIHPKWCEKILSGEKRIEVRKSAPKEVPFKCYIYCSYGNDRETYMLGRRGKVIGEFICDKIEDFYCASIPYQKENNLGYGRFIDNGVYKVNGWHEGIVFERNDRYIDTMLNNDDLKEMCLSAQELFDYVGVGKHLYAWHISDLKIYDKPRELSEFVVPCKTSCENCKKVFFYDCWETNGKVKAVTRPPQSWCYVEEEK